MTPTSVTVTGLLTTPIKALQLLPRAEIDLRPFGAPDNRTFYLIDDRSRMVNGKQIGRLSAVRATYEPPDQLLRLEFPDGAEVSGTLSLGDELETRFFSRRVTARLVGGPWAEAISEYVGRELRLVRPEGGLTGVDRGPAAGVSLISRGSLSRLAQAAGAEVDGRRFRMLIEIEGVEAHAEDGWLGRRLAIGDAEVEFHGHVGRCLVTGQNPVTGAPDLPTLDLLRSYRQHVEATEPLPFGIYGEVVRPGRVRVGDPVRLLGSGA